MYLKSVILPGCCDILFISSLKEGIFVQNVGAADKAAIQLVKVQPYQLLVSDT